MDSTKIPNYALHLTNDLRHLKKKMKFFTENFTLNNVICTDLPGPSRQPWLQKSGVISMERPDTKTQRWFTEIHSFLNLHPPKLTYYKNDRGNIVGVDSHDESLEFRQKRIRN